MRKNAEKLMKINQKTKVLGELFEHFTTNGWIFESLKLPEYITEMTPKELLEFPINTKDINWSIAVRVYIYGLQKYILMQDVVNPGM
jgi:hypothetical protein